MASAVRLRRRLRLQTKRTFTLESTCRGAPSLSWVFEESEVECCEHEDDSYVHREPFPEPVSEEQNIDRDDHGRHQGYVKRNGRLASHLNSLLKVGAWKLLTHEFSHTESITARGEVVRPPCRISGHWPTELAPTAWQ